MAAGPDDAMHIPDGFLDAKTAIATAALSAVGVGFAVHQLRRTLPPRRVPMLGLGAAFVFAAQMVNFPVAGGTSGHLVGGALAASLLGVPAAIVVMTTVLIAQCFLFADGVITALGANVFNMAVVAPCVGWLIYRGVSRFMPGMRGRVAAVAFAGWCSTVVASVACAGQLAWSGTVAWTVAFPAMTGVHMLIALGEGSISALVFYAVARARPDYADPQAPAATGGFVRYGLLTAVGIALFVAPFACPWPDGLDSVAGRLGFDTQARDGMTAWFSEYRFPGVESAGLSVALAGAIGTAVVFLLAVLLSRIMVRDSSRPRARAGA